MNVIVLSKRSPVFHLERPTVADEAQLFHIAVGSGETMCGYVATSSTRLSLEEALQRGLRVCGPCSRSNEGSRSELQRTTMSDGVA